MSASNVARMTLDPKFAESRVPARPAAGWIRAVREALGMSARELADRMGVVQSRASAIEAAEPDGALKLSTLRRAAEALECELVYALVPKRSLSETVSARAREVARVHVARTAHHMALEDQAITAEQQARIVEDLAAELIDRRGLWTDPA